MVQKKVVKLGVNNGIGSRSGDREGLERIEIRMPTKARRIA